MIIKKEAFQYFLKEDKMLFPSFKKEHDGVNGSGGFTYIISLELFIIMTWENACLPFVE